MSEYFKITAQYGGNSFKKTELKKSEVCVSRRILWRTSYSSCKLPVKEYRYFHLFLHYLLLTAAQNENKNKPNTFRNLGLAGNKRNTESAFYYLSFSCLFSFQFHQRYPSTKDNLFFPIFVTG